MARRIPEHELEAIVAAVARRPGGVTARDIAESRSEYVLPSSRLEFQERSMRRPRYRLRPSEFATWQESWTVA